MKIAVGSSKGIVANCFKGAETFDVFECFLIKYEDKNENDILKNFEKFDCAKFLKCNEIDTKEKDDKGFINFQNFKAKQIESIDVCFNGARFIADILQIKGINVVIGRNFGSDLLEELTCCKIQAFESSVVENTEALSKFLQCELQKAKGDSKFDDINDKSCFCKHDDFED